MILLRNQVDLGQGMKIFYITDLPNKTVSVQIEINNPIDDDVSELDVMLVAVSIQDADRVELDFGVLTDQDDSGSGTAVSSTFDSKEGELLIDFLSYEALSTSSTPNAGQTEIFDEGVAGILGRIAVSTELGIGASEQSHTMGWTIGASEDFLYQALRIKPALVYYIEDATSIAQYGLRVKILPLGEYRAKTSATRTLSANAMYSRTEDFLTKHKDPVTYYTLEVAHLPGHARDWWAGDAFLLDYQDPDTQIDVREELICTRRRATYDEDAVRHWDITLATHARHREDIEEAFYSLIQRIGTIQNTQV
jgi:hypothetical protein